MSTPKEDALRYALITGLAGTLGGGGLAYLASKVSATPDADTLTATAPELVDIPMPEIDKKRKQNAFVDKANITEKSAFGVMSVVPSGLLSGNFWKGDYAKHVSEVPWLPAAAIGLPVVGGAAAYGITESILKAKRAKEREEELQEAEEAYNKALLGSYDPSKLGLTKASLATEIGEGLDKLASLLKIADSRTSMIIPSNLPSDQGGINLIKTFRDNVIPDVVKDKATGLTAGAAGALALLGISIPAFSAYTAYNYYRDRDKTKLLNDAAKSRQIARMETNRPEPFVQIEE